MTQVEIVLAVVENLREVCAARMEIKPTSLAVVDEAQNFISTRIADPLLLARRVVVKFENAFSVKGDIDDRSCHSAYLVQVKLIRITVFVVATVFETNASFLAPITSERDFCVFKF